MLTHLFFSSSWRILPTRALEKGKYRDSNSHHHHHHHHASRGVKGVQNKTTLQKRVGGHAHGSGLDIDDPGEDDEPDELGSPWQPIPCCLVL